MGQFGGALAIATLLAACGDDGGQSSSQDAAVADASGVDASITDRDAEVDKPRYFSHVPLSFDPATGRDSFTAQNIAEDASMVTLHFDFFGIPWEEFGTGTELPSAWVREMDEISNLLVSLDKPVFLALTPFHGTRDKLAPSASGESDLVLDQEFGSFCENIALREDAASIQSAYVAYTKYMVERFQPMYLGLGIEVNLYEKACPAVWQAAEDLLNHTYNEVREDHAELPILNSFKLEELWQASESGDTCFGYSTACLDSNIEKFSSLKSDLMALSTYPLVPSHNNGSLPDGWFDEVAQRVSMPLAIAETGYQAASIQVAIKSGCFDALVSDVEAQTNWMRRVIEEAQEHEMPFVTWWSNHDLMSTSISGDCQCENAEEDWCGFLNPLPSTLKLLYQFFGSMGLRDIGGDPRPAHALWMAAQEE